MFRPLSTTACLLALAACHSPGTALPPAPTADASAPSPAGTPWEQARARGSVFRGIGTEPGWWVEVGGGATPRLLAELDYGERRIDVATATTTADGYVGSTADGVAVSLTTARGTCSDGMSDTEYPASATLTVGGQTYRGCGRFLTE